MIIPMRKADVTTMTPVSVCECGAKLDCCTGDTLPNPGDVTICFSCTAVYQFGHDMTLIRTHEYDSEPVIQAGIRLAIDAMAGVILKRGKLED